MLYGSLTKKVTQMAAEFWFFFKWLRGLRQPVGATKAWSTRILEPTDHISRVGQDSEVAKSTRSVVVANPDIE